MSLLVDIKHIADVQHLARIGFSDWARYGEVTVSEAEGFLLFNYNQQTQLNNRWNVFEQISRGLIIERATGEVVARAFDKFFNWLEGDRCSNGQMVSITEKMDGSLGVLYRVGHEYRIASRNSLKSEQAQWATQFLQQHYDLTTLPPELTLLFEIIYPENRIVVDYGDRQALVLIGARNRWTGEYLTMAEVEALALRYGFDVPTIYHFAHIDDIMAQLPILSGHEEGFVVEFSDGQRFKFKGNRYLELHGIVLGLSFNSVLGACRTNTLAATRLTIPEEFLRQFDQWANQILTQVAQVKAQIAAVFATMPTGLTRKELAGWINTHHPSINLYLFAMADGKALEPLIYRNAFKDS